MGNMGADITITMPTLHTGQQAILAGAGRFNILMCGRRMGKTTLCTVNHARAMLEGKATAWFCPTYKLLADPWREMIRMLRPVIRSVNKQERRIELITNGTIDFWTADTPDAGRGRSYDLATVDEAGLVRDLNELLYGSVFPTLAQRRGILWAPGTPKGCGEFYRMYQRGKAGTDPEMRSFNGSMADNPYIPRDEIERLRLVLPTAIYDQEVNGIPIEGSTNPFGIDAIRRQVAPLSGLPPVVFGVDLAQRVDWTVIVGLDVNGHVCHFDRFQHVPWPETMARVAQAVGEIPAVVDATGVGVPIVDDLRRRVSNIIPFVFTRPSKQQLMGGLSLAIQRGDVSYPAGPIVDELESFEVAYAAGGASYQAPDGLHDDCVCALAMAVSQIGNQYSGDILSIC